MENNDRIWIMMGRSLSGELNADEQKELNSMLQCDPHLHEQYSMLKKLWNKNYSQHNILEEENNEKNLFRKIINKAEIERQTSTGMHSEVPKPFIQKLFSPRKIYAYAACIVVAILFFIGNSQRDNLKPVADQVISAQNGSRSKVLLPDGTTVWLNGGSMLYYDYEFSGPLREVRLDGEAYFDVVKQKDRPFIVHAGKINIRVHGTAFNVKYYKGDKTIETTLIHGKIEVTDNVNKAIPPVFLSPNQKLIIAVAESKSAKPDQKPVYELIRLNDKLLEKERIETAWIYNRIEFRGERFDDLAKKLERWYNVTIQFEDEEVKALMFNGSFEKETVDQAFNALQKVGTFNYKIQGREILIKSSE